MSDELGNIIDGDQIIAALATRWKNKRMLKGGVVGTLMSNYGLEKFLKSEKIKFIRANVGDRYVKKNEKNSFNLGGVTIWTHHFRKICNNRRWFTSCVRGIICN